MTSTPPRTPSRPHTPSPSPRLTPYVSVSSLHPRYTPSRTASQSTLTALPPRLHVTTSTSSPASSVFNVDLNEAIILRDPDEEDAEITESEEQVEGIFAESKETGEERKKILRDHLRRSLKRKATSTPLSIVNHSFLDTSLALGSSLRQTQKDPSALDATEVLYSPGTCHSSTHIGSFMWEANIDAVCVSPTIPGALVPV
ncbi:hypothetical protein JB92DRAFT_1185825 [Gautieria morchelliformis]|nr:hypothetical protein JB92DRAFT_1185825 [Gautieria morchelliformis]